MKRYKVWLEESKAFVDVVKASDADALAAQLRRLVDYVEQDSEFPAFVFEARAMLTVLESTRGALWCDTDGLLRSIATVAHAGGRLGLDAFEALNYVRRGTLRFWSGEGTHGDLQDRVGRAIEAIEREAGHY